MKKKIQGNENVPSKYTNLNGREERYYKKSTTNLIRPKKTMDPGTQRRKNKVSKRPFDLTGSNKVTIVGKCPFGKSLATPGG